MRPLGLAASIDLLEAEAPFVDRGCEIRKLVHPRLSHDENNTLVTLNAVPGRSYQLRSR
jgi:hypothetical protein